jgi:hypothetical protein
VAPAAALRIAVIYYSVWKHTPICLREAHANGGARVNFEGALAAGPIRRLHHRVPG